MNPPRHLFIVNPRAKHGACERIAPLLQHSLSHIPHDLVETTHPGHATTIAAAATDYHVIVAVGGDGTVHEVLNGLMRHPTESRPALGILPTGSGNDSCRTYGIPFAIRQAARVLAQGNRRRFDIGTCNGRFFNNSFAAGLDAKVTAQAVEFKTTKRRAGLWLYSTALLHVLFHDFNSHTLQVAFDDQTPTLLDTLLIALTIGPTYGGGFRITPHADPADGLFDLCRIDPCKLHQALWRLPFVIVGRHTWMSVVHMTRHRSLTLESAAPLPAQIDGEVLLDTRYHFTMLPRAIECVVPPQP
jgi:YegS/Rv2252/BmrU family lipid kinase